MKAVLCTEFGPPESLTLQEVDDPRPGEGQVVIDVHACSVNFPDLLMIQDMYQFKPPMPFSPGAEVSGVIRSVGDGVSNVEPGDRVFASTGHGGLAEQVLADARSVVPLPDGLDMKRAAAFLYAYGTSHYALTDRARLQPGESLLVLGAAGGVGLAAVELGAAMGAHVIAAASTDEKLAVCREHGATGTINYSTEDLKARTRELTGGAGADVIYDAVGGPYSEPALRATAWEGRFLVIGFAAGDIPKLPLNLPLLKGCSVVGVFWGSFVGREPERHQQNVAELTKWWQEGRISPYISATFSLERSSEAIRQLADRKATGKVVVEVAAT